MKKEIKYYEYFCDKCGEKTKNLYGPDGGNVGVALENISQSQTESATLTVSYFLSQNSAAKIDRGSICEKCLYEILRKAIKQIPSPE